MKNLKILLAGILLLGLSYAAGRYSVSQEKSEVKVTENKKIEKDTHTVTKTTTTKKPNGEEVIVTTTTKDTNTEVKDTKKSDTKTEAGKRSVVTVQALIALQPKVNMQPTYGISISKQLLGPVVLGAFGLDNGTFGASLGLEF